MIDQFQLCFLISGYGTCISFSYAIYLSTFGKQESLRYMNIKSKVTLTLNICLDVSHLEVVVDPVDNKVREPWVLSSNLEQLVEKL